MPWGRVAVLSFLHHAMSQVDLYELKRGGDPPLIGVHGAGGILFFGRLARYLGRNQSFYVLHGRGLDRYDGKQAFTGIQQLAAAYADAAVDLAGDGPVYLCGRWGPIVLETGCEMLARGVNTVALIVFDTAPGRARKQLSESGSNQGSHIRALAKRIPGLSTVRARWRARRKRSRYPADKPFRPVNGELTREYVPRKFHGRIVLIFSEQFAGNPSKRSREESWRSLCDELHVHITPGTHKQHFYRPGVERVGALVQTILDDDPGLPR